VALGGSVGAERLLAAGYDNGDVVLFDLRARAVRWQANVGGAVTALDFDRPDAALNKLVVATLEASFRVYDMHAPAEDGGGGGGGGGYAHVAERAHKATVWLAKHTPHNRDLWATAGGNGGINLYKYHYPDKRAARAGADGAAQAGVMGGVELLNARILAPQPIAGFDWHADRPGLACAVALDQTAKALLVTKLDQY